MVIYLGADHGGYELKEKIKKILSQWSYQYEDLGNSLLDSQDDYPDFAKLVAQKVSETSSLGVLICGTGLGMLIAANKIQDIRAVLCCNEYMAEQAKSHLNANILCLGGWIHKEADAQKIVKKFLETTYLPEDKYNRRIKKINQMEQ